MLLCAAIATTDSLAQIISQPEPVFPGSERSREGWVVLNFTINEDGVVLDLSIKDSSGSSAFNEAALAAVRDWRFDTAGERRMNVLLNFVFERSQVHLSGKFMAHIKDVHESIDNDDLGVAMEHIDAFRKKDNFGAYELAYSLIAEGRIAGVRGDKAEQLRVFRRAIVNHGHWLERDKYLMLLHSIVVLEVQQQEFASALSNFEVLTETRQGRKVARELEVPMQSIKTLLESGVEFAPAYTVANMEMTIEHVGRVLQQDVQFRDGYFGNTDQLDEAPETGE